MKEARTFRFTCAGLWEPMNRACSCVAVGESACCDNCGDVRRAEVTACVQTVGRTYLVIPAFRYGIEGLLERLELLIKVLVHIGLKHPVSVI